MKTPVAKPKLPVFLLKQTVSKARKANRIKGQVERLQDDIEEIKMNKKAYEWVLEKEAAPMDYATLPLLMAGVGAGAGGLSRARGHSRLESMGRGMTEMGATGLGGVAGWNLADKLSGGNAMASLLGGGAGALAGSYGGSKLADLMLGKKVPKKSSAKKAGKALISPKNRRKILAGLTEGVGALGGAAGGGYLGHKLSEGSGWGTLAGVGGGYLAGRLGGHYLGNLIENQGQDKKACEQEMHELILGIEKDANIMDPLKRGYQGLKRAGATVKRGMNTVNKATNKAQDVVGEKGRKMGRNLAARYYKGMRKAVKPLNKVVDEAGLGISFRPKKIF